MTAGNSSPLTDGASTVLLASEDWAREHNLPVWPGSRTPRRPRSTSSTATRGC